MASDHEKYDAALLAILQNEGKVAPFLDVILGFLYRRTDFFRIMNTTTDRLGFPPGIAHKLLENIFRKYETLAKADSKKIEEMRKAREIESKENEAKENEMEQQNASVQASVEEMSVSASEATHTSNFDERGKEESVTMSSSSPVEMESDNSESTADNSEHPTSDTTEQSVSVDDPDLVSTSKSEGHDDEEKEDPEQARLRRGLQANPLTYNGAERDAYYWSQTISETDLRVKVPKFIVKGKQVKVDIKKNHINVSMQGNDGSWSDIVDNELSWEIKPEDCMWSLSPGEFVHINLEKKQERWWENVFVDEPKINTRKIDCSRPMTELDDEAQSKIEELMYNQRQKQLGLPQSHEMKTHEMLRKAWDAEGSPFKGQPFDPSRFSVDPSGTVNFNNF